MNQSVFNFLKGYGYEPFKVDRLIISAFLIINEISVRRNELLLEYYIPENTTENEGLCKFIQLLKLKESSQFDFEKLIELFEFVISPADKEINGAVYTPKYIRDYILKETFRRLNDKGNIEKVKVADIACGCGGFLFDAAKIIKRKTGKTYYRIFKENIFGLDIQAYSIQRTKLLLTLLAVSEGEEKENFKFNLFEGNALNFDWAFIVPSGFQAIVGNPPYVGASKIDAESLALLKNWSVTATGKADLYIPFFQIALESLSTNGILGYITVNTFIKSVNGRALREYLSQNNFGIEIIDFSGEQVFRKRSTYTCICLIQCNEQGAIKYLKAPSKSINTIKRRDFLSFSSDVLDDSAGWLLESRDATDIIRKIEGTGTQLGELCLIRNGFATLRNDIYVFKPIDENDIAFLLSLNGREHWIEKAICKKVIKPNILRSEDDIPQIIEQAIFPYEYIQERDLFGEIQNVSIKIFEEIFFQEQYPLSYNYLLSQQEELAKRDKGKKTYEKWYAYGRNQALTITGFKLLFPYIGEKPCFIFTEQQDLLFYNGYAIISDSREDLLVLKKILCSSLFWYYLSHSSKPYGNDYFSFAKNYIKRFGICDLTEEERQFMLNEEDQTRVNIFLQEKYNIEL